MPNYTRSDFLTGKDFHYCSGCTHGTVHRIVADTLGSLTARENVIGVASVGCSVFAYDYFNCDMQQAAHGRAPAVATGIKRVLPDRVVFTYQGDGDLASIGLAEIVHACARNENITVIFINNGIYGMTGDQMAPTTLEGQKTTTSADGRQISQSGFPIKICELLSTLEGPQYIARTSCHDVRSTVQTERAVKKAFSHQLAGKGFSLVEVLSGCPTNFKLSPVDMNEHIAKVFTAHFPLGEFKKGES